MRRRLPIVFTALLLTLTAGCKSNNADGRLVGTWLCTNVPKAPLGSGITATWVFGADKTFSFTVRGPGGSKTFGGQYRLGFGNTVYFDHLSEPIAGKDILTDEITISGNQMTARDPDGTTTTLTKQQ